MAVASIVSRKYLLNKYLIKGTTQLPMWEIKTMMTADEFISIYKKLRKQGTTIVVLYLISGVCTILFIILAAIFMERNRAHEWVAAITAVYVLACVVSFPVQIWFTKHTMKKYSSFCPHCKKPLVGMYFEIAKATGLCGDCRQKVFITESSVR